MGITKRMFEKISNCVVPIKNKNLSTFVPKKTAYLFQITFPFLRGVISKRNHLMKACIFFLPAGA